MTAQAWCSRAIRVGFSAALANVLAMASSATEAMAIILTERVIRRLNGPDGLSGCVGVALEAERKHLMISFTVAHGRKRCSCLYAGLIARAAPPTRSLLEIGVRPRQRLSLARRGAAVWADRRRMLF
jgi:hypothetical protein